MSENNIFSYTRRDYENSRQEGISKIPIISNGKWTDLNVTDPGIIILDYVHALVDMMQYYQDHQALEAFITTAKERANIFRLAKQLSYDIRSSKGAICDVEFTSSSIYGHTVKIPKHTSLSTKSGIKYLTMQDAYLLAGEHRVVVPCYQGKLVTINYKGTGISRFSNVVGAKNQSIRLVDNNIDIESIEIIDDRERLWSPIDYIIFSTELDRVYQSELNTDNSITIYFGDGLRGIIPSTEDDLTISYISTLAEEGRVESNSITILETSIKDDTVGYIEFSVNNNNPSTGGSSSQSSREIRETAPGAIKAQGRAVTLGDYESLAKLVDGVADAKAYDINTLPDLCLYHEVKVIVVPKNSEDSLDTLKKIVYDYLSRRAIPPVNVQVITPSYIYLDLSVTIEKRYNNISDSRLQYNVTQTIIDYFKSRERDIGESFYPLSLATTIMSIEGVKDVAITPNEVYHIGEFSAIKLGKLDLHIR